MDREFFNTLKESNKLLSLSERFYQEIKEGKIVPVSLGKSYQIFFIFLDEIPKQQDAVKKVLKKMYEYNFKKDVNEHGLNTPKFLEGCGYKNYLFEDNLWAVFALLRSLGTSSSDYTKLILSKRIILDDNLT